MYDSRVLKEVKAGDLPVCDSLNQCCLSNKTERFHLKTQCSFKDQDLGPYNALFWERNGRFSHGE